MSQEQSNQSKQPSDSEIKALIAEERKRCAARAKQCTIPAKGFMWNPIREFPRNDPCPCGSGKKFKKCHRLLMADIIPTQEYLDQQRKQKEEKDGTQGIQGSEREKRDPSDSA
jgi:hypothetical protein